MRVVLIDYGSGNLRSAAKAFERALADGDIRGTVEVASLPDTVRLADRVVLPGVGAFADCMNGLENLPGMHQALEEVVGARGRPFLGICVGMQLMARWGREHGDHKGLGWIPGEVVPLAPNDPALKIPHMGWNALEFERPHPVLDGIEPGRNVYFVHSYHFEPEDRAAIAATADYGGPVTAVVARDNLFGTQFHPEKSQAVGLRLIANFLKWAP